jgi:hypothetical protein
MNKYILLILLILPMLSMLTSCEEEFSGQYAVDSIPPKPVGNPQVVNFPGGATITYTLPDETDLLYVGVKYTLPNGNVQDMKVSVFTNSLTVKGFSFSQEYRLQLFAVDRSGNASAPCEVVIHPEDAPIYTILKTLQCTETFGGFKVDWENPWGEDITITFLKKNEAGAYELVDAIYSSEKEAHRAVRGQESKPATFAVYIKDLYNNHTDTTEFTITPWFEMQLNKSNFLEMPKLPAFQLHDWGLFTLNALWDDNLGIDDPMGVVYYIRATEGINAYFTMDLGVTARLSRFRFWGRGGDWYFRLHNPYDFYLMGTNDPAVAQNSASQDSDWTLLDNFISKRPSGKDSNQAVTVGDEDWLYATAGEEFELPNDAPAVRYIRFRVRKSWSGTNALHLAEIRFWGNPENN